MAVGGLKYWDKTTLTFRTVTDVNLGSPEKASLTGATFTGPIRPGSYLLTTLPSAAVWDGHLIDVVNATGGPKLCRSNGTVWQIVNTGTTVS